MSSPLERGCLKLRLILGLGIELIFVKKEILLLLLGGGGKKGQQKAIDAAKLAWKIYDSDRKQSARKEKRK